MNSFSFQIFNAARQLSHIEAAPGMNDTAPIIDRPFLNTTSHNQIIRSLSIFIGEPRSGLDGRMLLFRLSDIEMANVFQKNKTAFFRQKFIFIRGSHRLII